jgi:hypothetical protein
MSQIKWNCLKCNLHFISEFITEITVKSAALRSVTPCVLVDRDQRFCSCYGATVQMTSPASDNDLVIMYTYIFICSDCDTQKVGAVV